MRKKTVHSNKTPYHSQSPESAFVAFFSGALGLDIGFEHAGLSCLAANDADPVAGETVRANRPDLPLYDCDIRTLTAEKLLRELHVDRDQLFAVTGGPPCQAFSTAGR